MRSSSRSMRIMHLSEPPGSFFENNLPAAFLAPFAVVELSTGIDPSIPSQRWLQTERCRWMSLQQPVQRENPQCSLTSHLADMSTDVQSGEVSAFLGIMLGPAIGHEKSPSDCSLERYRKPGSLAGMVRAEAFQWNHKWYGYRAKQRQAVKTYACTVLISTCWLYCTSSAKLKKCLERAWNRKDKP